MTVNLSEMAPYFGAFYLVSAAVTQIEHSVEPGRGNWSHNTPLTNVA
jgi:hypothetical protein